MASIKKFNKDNGKWEVHGSSIASEIALLDMEGNFQSGNVEGALRENAKKILDQEIKSNANNDTIKTHSSMIREHSSKLAKHEEDIEWLKENGGGGSGGSAPTITSNFLDGTIVEKGKDVEIPIFYSSPNLGDGLAYVVIDGIEVKTQIVKQGNNKVNIGKLPNLKNEVAIYVKDRANKLSNQLSWNIVCGGIDLDVDFDSEADYSINDIILMKFDVQSASDEPIVMHLTIDYDTYEVTCNQGHNEYIFKNLGVGIHKINFYLTSGPYRTQVKTFNIVIVNATSLYVSSNFEGGDFEAGNPISINYRISKMGTEVFTVNLILDDTLVKTLRATAGSYYWTLNGADIGEHKIKIVVTSDYGEYAFTEKEFRVVQGEYTPLKINEAGLVYRLNAEGKTNNDINRDSPADSSGNGIKTTLHNFNYYTNGWINDTLVCDGNSYVEIDCYPYSDNAIYGSTIEIQYKGLDIGFDDARIIDYTDIETPYKGFYIDLNESTMKSLANTGKVYTDSDVWTTLSFVIDRKNKFAKIYIDGICSRAFSLSDSGSGINTVREDFTHQQKIYLNSRKGIDKFGACEIKEVRVYSRVLSDDEILQNNIAQIKDMKEQRELYNHNYNNTSLPTIRMYGDMTNMTLETPVQMRIKYTSPNDELYGQSFDLPYCDVNWQGTSSLQYVLKNFTARLKDENMSDYEYTPYKNGVPETVYCFKCDYMESTHSRNTGLAKFVNECLYDSKNPAQLKNPNVRNTVNGFPTLLYINDELQGVYNFNLDRYSTNSYGYHDDGNCLVYEVSANSDTTAGAFYKWTEASGKDKLDYYKSDFECLFPPSRVVNDNMEELIRLVEWVNDSSDEDFRDNIHNYFNKEYLLRYYLYVLVVGAVDSLGKNMKLATWDGRIWFPQVYDADTSIGLDNTGFLKFGTDIEMGDANVFNTTGSKLWKKVTLLFERELQEQYAIMRQKYFTVDNFMKYILEEQIEKIPARYYNIDMQTKYLNYGSSYLYALHGSGEQHIRKWLRERLIYVDTLLGYNVSTSDYITLRSSKLGEVYLDIETYIPMYLRVKWRDEAGGTGTQVKRVGKGEKVRFSYNMPTATDQEIIVYGGHYLKSLGDVSNLQPTSMLIANADRLTEITCHSPNLINTDLSECTKLQKIDLSDCTALGTGIGAQPILNIQNCKYLKYCNCNNTQLTAIYTMSAGGNLEEIYYPSSTQVVELNNQTYLKTIGIPRGEDTPKNLAQVSITNCKNVEYIQSPYIEGEELDFKVLKYVQDLRLTNSLDKLRVMTFDGFEKMKSINISTMYELEQVQFDNMLPRNTQTNLKTIALSDIPKLDKITFNVDSNNYKVEFSKNAVVDLGGLNSVKVIESNTDIKGLDKLVIPVGLEQLKLDGNNSMKNVWSANASHIDDNYEGIDFIDMENLNYINMQGLPNIKNAINFNLTLKDINPNLNAYRDGSNEKPWFRPTGRINISNYTGDLEGLFKGLDLNKIDILCDEDLLQENASRLFEYTLCDGEVNSINNVLKHLVNARILKRIFKDSNLSSIVDIKFADVENLDLEEAFINLPIKEDYIFTPNTVNVTRAFKGCKELNKIHSNWTTKYTNGITPTDCYGDSNKITHIDGEEIIVDKNNHCRDSIPKEWGGFGFDMETTSIFKIDTNLLSTNTFTVPNECVSVSWGDGTTTNGGGSHEYDEKGIYTLKIKNKLDTSEIYKLNGSVSPIIEIQQVAKKDSEGNAITDFSKCFAYNSNLTSINLNNIKDNPITNLESTFKNTPKLKTIIGLENLNLDNLENISETFRSTSFTNWGQITEWTVNRVVKANSLFKDCNLDGLDLSSWIFENCIDFASMFENTNISIDISNWNVKGNLSSMFKNCNIITGIETLDLSKVDNIDNLMHGCKNTSIDLSNSNLNPLSTSINMVANMPNLTSINLNNIFDNNIIEILSGLLETPSGIIYTKTIKHTYPKIKGWKYEANEDYCFLRYSFTNKKYEEIYEQGNEEPTIKITEIDIMPTFNEGFLYGYEDEVVEDITTRNIFIEDIVVHPILFEDKELLPKFIKFTDKADLLTVDKIVCRLENIDNMFKGCTSLTNVNLDNVILTENVTSMISLFEDCMSLQIIDLTNIDTTNINSFENMFKGCINLSEITGLEVISLDNASSLSCMLEGTRLVELDLSNWNLSNVSNISGLFKDCDLLTKLNLNTWNLQSVSTYDETFEGCTSLNHIDMYDCDDSTFIVIPPILPVRDLDNLGYVYSLTVKSTYGTLVNGWDYELEWEFLKYSCIEGQEFLPTFNAGFEYDLLDNTKDGVTTRRFAMKDGITTFANISGFASKTSLLSIDKIKGKITTLANMFNGCTGLTRANLEGLDTTGVSNASNMFYGCEVLTDLKVTGLDMSEVTNISTIFSKCYLLPIIDLTGWKLDKLQSMASAFNNCSAVTYIYGLEGFNASNVPSLANLFYGCKALKSVKGLEKWNVTSKTTAMTNTFYECSSLTDINVIKDWRPKISSFSYTFYKTTSPELDLSGWDISGLTALTSAFANCNIEKLILYWGDKTKNIKSFEATFNRATVKEIVGINTWNVSSATTMRNMFYSVPITEIDLSSWDVSSCTRMDSMFYGCSKLQKIIGLEELNPVSVQNMQEFLKGCSSLTGTYDLSGWDMSQKTNIAHMFGGAGGTLICKGWDLSGVKSLSYIFSEGLQDYIDVTGWQTQNATSMVQLFLRNTAREIVGFETWDLSQIDDATHAFQQVKEITRIEVPSTLKKITKANYMFLSCAKVDTLILNEVSFDNTTAYTNLANGISKLKTVSLVGCSDTTITKVVNTLTNRSTTDKGTIYVSPGSVQPTKTGFIYSVINTAYSETEPILNIELTKDQYERLITLLNN